MKLNYKRTLLVGFAFFLICTFWGAYDAIIPKILTDHFGMAQAMSGIVMALDNILALFMLPLFGSLSDKCRTRIGKRKPFILGGTIVAACAFVALTFADGAQLTAIRNVSGIDDPASMQIIYEGTAGQEIKTPDGVSFVLSERFLTEESFLSVKSKIHETRISSRDILITPAGETSKVQVGGDFKTRIVTYDGETFWFRDRQTEIDTEIGETISVNGTEVSLKELYASGTGSADKAVPAFSEVTNSLYTNYLVPARQAYIGGISKANPTPLIWFMVILIVVLIAMSTFRSPAVALMPDVTVKPLRSKANAIINLMGTFGGMIVLVLGMGFAFNTAAIGNTFRSYFSFFLTVALIMLAALAVFMITVREPRWTDEQEKATALLDKENGKEEEGDGDRKLSPAEKRSLLLILASVVLWFFGYNAVTSKYSVYATSVLDLDFNTTLLVANAAAIVSYIPVGIISSKVGRKKTIMAGILMLATAFFVACFMRVGSSAMLMNVMFALAGVGWATINVNSFPMVVELSKGSSIGKYTGYYYAASMGAQVLTPFLSGLCMDNFGMTSLFPYAVVFVLLSFTTMLFVKHGDSKPIPKQSLLEQMDAGDD